MTVQLTASATTYVADGAQSAFSIPFEAADVAYIKVYLDNVQVTLGYTINGSVLIPGAVVLFNTPPPAGVTVKILRITPQLQSTIYTTYGAYKAKQIEADFDRMVMLIQELQYAVDHPPPIVFPPTPTAAQISFAPAGGIEATNVQAALQETDQEWRAADQLQVPKATGISSADTDTLVIGNPTLAQAIVLATRTNVPLGLLKLDGSGKVPSDLLQTVGLRFLGVWDPIVQGSVPPLTAVHGDYYLFNTDGGMTLLTSTNTSPHSVSVVLNDQMIYDTSGVDGWYYVHTSQPVVIAAVNVSFDPVGSIVASNVQGAIAELDADISDRFHESGFEIVMERFNGIAKESVIVSSADGVRLLRNSQDRLATTDRGANIYGNIPNTNPTQSTLLNLLSSDAVQQAYLYMADTLRLGTVRIGTPIELIVMGAADEQKVLVGTPDGNTILNRAGERRFVLVADGVELWGRDVNGLPTQRIRQLYTSADGVVQAQEGFLGTNDFLFDIVRAGASFQIQFPNGVFFNINPNTAVATLGASLTVNGQVSVSAPAPTAANHLTRKDYVDTRLTGFTSADTAIPPGTGGFSVPHNLGSTPSEFSAYLVNAATQYGHTPGQVIPLPQVIGVGGAFVGYGYGADATNIWFSNSGIAPYIVPRLGGTPSPITPASWRVRLFARR